MGKEEQNQDLERQQQQQRQNHGTTTSGCFFSSSCCCCCSSISKEFSFRCVFVLTLSLALLVSAIFWILPFHFHALNLHSNGFDARDSIKRSATVHASFRLPVPVSELLSYIEELEYDIYGEIGVPDTKVAILSMHQPGASNWTDVVFGVLSDPANVSINPVYLSVLRSSLIELFLQQLNLTLTTSIFGQPYMFEIFKFPGGITVIPVQDASIFQMPQILFNFTLNNSVSEILENLVELKDQLKYGLHLRPYENVYVQMTNVNGSTTIPPVTVQASVMSDLGSLLPQRLKQLAQTITDSPAKNLGLDNSVFGKVKSVILSSYLKGTLHANPPVLPPAPSPHFSDYARPEIAPASSPSHSPSPSPSDHRHSYAKSPRRSPKNGPYHSYPHVHSSAPAAVTVHPPDLCPDYGSTTPPSSSPSHSNPSPYSHPIGPPSRLPPDLSPVPHVSYGTNLGKGSLSPSVAPSPLALSPTSLAVGKGKETWLLGISGLLILLLCWPH